LPKAGCSAPPSLTMSKGTDESSSQSDGAEDRFLDGSISKPVSTRFHVSKSELSSQVLNNRLTKANGAWRKPIRYRIRNSAPELDFTAVCDAQS
jgi:hypothetical protein